MLISEKTGNKTLDTWDREHSWHPFTQMKEYANEDLLHFVKGEGCWLIDTESRRYLDGNAAIWTNVHGYSDPDLLAILNAQANHLPHSSYLGFSNPPAAELCHRLAEISPRGLSRTYFTNNGATAVETALKMSFQYWKLVGQAEKRGVISMEGAFHGNTFGAMAVSQSEAFHRRFKHWLFPSQAFPAPICEEFGGKIYAEEDTHSIEVLTQILEKEAKTTACLILEPNIQGAAGMCLQPSGFLKKVEQLCKAYNIHLILDEVFVGFCRTGPLLVSAEENIETDFLCLGKGFTGGYLPLAATLTTERVYEAFYGDFHEEKTFYHGHSISPSAITAQLALKNTEKLQKLIANGSIAQKIDHFNATINRYFSQHPWIEKIRQRGFACALFLKDNNPARNRYSHKICLKARERGILIRPLGKAITLTPPLAILNEEMDFLCEQTSEAIDTFFK